MAEKFIADLHIHSRHSLATSRELVPEMLDLWARCKGITVVGSGDFTHAGWLQELKEKLEPAEPGLFRLKAVYSRCEKMRLPWLAERTVRFLLSGEISTIYQKNGKVRKVHCLIFAPGWQEVENLRRALLRRQANLDSDGRPILGMDCKDLLDLTLQASAGGMFFVPAHIWTPWFSVLGDKSGFDSIEECFGALSEHIHAVETGLSSDPPMNRLCSFLDRFVLISNSDAHSPEKLGREANLFNTELSYMAMVNALKNGNPEQFLGTIEFFPQEGKYHFDGHRRCQICWHPSETVRQHGRCPVCGKPVTVGVLHRVRQLATRREDGERPLRHSFYSLIPLREIFSEILGVGPGSKKVENAYLSVLKALGPELEVLLDTSLERIRDQVGAELAEAIARMRSGDVFIQEGYDGEYGRIRVFGREGDADPNSQKALFATPAPEAVPVAAAPPASCALVPRQPSYKESPRNEQPAQQYAPNPQQLAAIAHHLGPALIIAGPGTGKTFVLSERIANLISTFSVPAEKILAITFTNKAAQEVRERLHKRLSPVQAKTVRIATFHAFGLAFLRRHWEHSGRQEGFKLLDEEERLDLIASLLEVGKTAALTAAEKISCLKQAEQPAALLAHSGLDTLFANYETELQKRNAFDFDDLIARPYRLLRENAALANQHRQEEQFILVDECQDMNENQYALLASLQPPPAGNLVLVGDPDQAIYGFRGANPALINRFQQEYVNAQLFRLSTSYRCSDTILRGSANVVQGRNTKESWLAGLQPGVRIQVSAQQSGRSEAEFVARTIEEMIGGTRFYSLDSRVASGQSELGITSLADFAVLCRLSAQTREFQEAFRNHGLPCQVAADPSFFKREPIKTLLALLRLSLTPEPRPKGIKLPAGMGRAKLSQANLAEILRRAAGQTNNQGKIAFLLGELFPVWCQEHGDERERLLDLAGRFGTGGMEEFLSLATLGSAADTLCTGMASVSLLTIHAAKGLEFACVFVPGCEEGLLPYTLFSEKEVDRAEERRLLYVAMTRAKRHLYLTHSRQRTLFGKRWQLPRSSFLDCIETELLELSRAEPARKTAKAPQQRKLFDT